MPPTRIVYVDIETAPSLGWVWGKWQQDVIDFKDNWYMLSFAYKVLGEGKVYIHALPDYKGYAKDRENDKLLVEEFWKVLDAADIVIGHNIDKFDVKKANTRFITHGLPPPSPYKTVDTLKIARKMFRFDCNKLDELGRYLGVGRKMAHTGFDLWHSCMLGDEKAWETLRRYNVRDILLLERIYLLMRPWATNHANVNHGGPNCPKCGSAKVQRRGWEYTLLKRKQRFQCQSCAGWFYGPAVKVEEAK